MPKSLKHKARMKLNLSPLIVTSINDEFEEIGTSAIPSRRHWLEFLSILVAFLGGALTIYTVTSGTNIAAAGTWKFLLVPAATLCIGFGAAALLYGRLREKQARALREQVASIRARADALVANFYKFERGKHVS